MYSHETDLTSKVFGFIYHLTYQQPPQIFQLRIAMVEYTTYNDAKIMCQFLKGKTLDAELVV